MKGIIYKIEMDEDNIYIGSTTQKLCVRQSNHNSNLKKYPQRKLYKTFIENNITSIKCIWVADCEYNSNAELRKIEEDYRKELNGNLNSVKCYITEEERKQYNYDYSENNREKELLRKKNYMRKNKDKFNESSKKYREEHKEYYNAPIKCDKCDCMINRHNMIRHQKTKKCIKISN